MVKTENNTQSARPNHVGFIVDGNRRWAKSHGLKIADGHKKGFEVLKQMAYIAKDRGIDYVSVFIFSTENWSRSKSEVSYLMRLFLRSFKYDMHKMAQDGFRIIFLGQRDRLSKDILKAIKETEDISSGNKGITLALCFNYGGRSEIVDASKKIAQALNNGDLSVEEVANFKESDFSNYLYHPDLPDIDLMVRTSGEERLSGFMLWRIAYSELLFIKKNWPDMVAGDFDFCLEQFAARQRRFGR